MDLNDVRVVVTVLTFVAFIGIVWWAYSSRRKATYDEAARMVLEDDDKPVHAENMAPHAHKSGSLPPTGGSHRPWDGPAGGGATDQTKH